MKVAAIVQARLGSTRLPAKVLLPLPTGRCVLEEVIHRCKQIQGVDVVVVAIPDTPENDIIVELMPGIMASYIKRRIDPPIIVRGPENDVLERYQRAAFQVDADVVIRITADCPLLDSNLCTAMLNTFINRRLHYVSNAWPVREVPHGYDCEIFTYDLLYSALIHAEEAYDREHVTPWMQKHSQKSGGFMIWKAMPDQSHIRLTLDTIKDYTAIWNEFKRREKEAA